MADAQARRRLAREFLTFAAVGVGGALVDMGGLALALRVGHTGPYLGRVCSYLVAATFTWAVNRRVTFRDPRRDGLIRQWAHYLAVNAVGGLVNFGVYSGIVAAAAHSWVAATPYAFAVPYAGVAAGSLAGLLFNFSGAKRLVFKAGRAPLAADEPL